MSNEQNNEVASPEIAGKSWADYSSESESDEGPITNEKVEPKYQEPDKYHQNVHHHHYHRQNYGDEYFEEYDNLEKVDNFDEYYKEGYAPEDVEGDERIEKPYYQKKSGDNTREHRGYSDYHSGYSGSRGRGRGYRNRGEYSSYTQQQYSGRGERTERGERGDRRSRGNRGDRGNTRYNKYPYNKSRDYPDYEERKRHQKERFQTSLKLSIDQVKETDSPYTFKIMDLKKRIPKESFKTFFDIKENFEYEDMEHYYLITVESQKLALEILEQAQENNMMGPDEYRIFFFEKNKRRSHTFNDDRGRGGKGYRAQKFVNQRGDYDNFGRGGGRYKGNSFHNKSKKDYQQSRDYKYQGYENIPKDEPGSPQKIGAPADTLFKTANEFKFKRAPKSEKKEEGELEGVETDSRKDSKTEERKSDPFGGITPRDEDTFKKEKSELELKKEESADLASEEVSIKYVKFEGNKTHEIPASFNTQIPKETANPQTEQIRIIQKDLPNQKNTNIQEEESKAETETKYFKGRGKNAFNSDNALRSDDIEKQSPQHPSSVEFVKRGAAYGNRRAKKGGRGGYRNYPQQYGASDYYEKKSQDEGSYYQKSQDEGNYYQKSQDEGNYYQKSQDEGNYYQKSQGYEKSDPSYGKYDKHDKHEKHEKPERHERQDRKYEGKSGKTMYVVKKPAEEKAQPPAKPEKSKKPPVQDKPPAPAVSMQVQRKESRSEQMKKEESARRKNKFAMFNQN